MDQSRPLGIEEVSLADAPGRYLAVPVLADRPLPPYDRATMDGIAFQFSLWKSGQRDFPVRDMARAGFARIALKDAGGCIEIATGAVMPLGTDTVVPYEDLDKTPGGFRIRSVPSPGQNIHRKGSDAAEGSELLAPGTRITAAEVGVLASVGKPQIQVWRLPRVCVITTGDELVDVNQKPDDHQIRRSNSYALQAALGEFCIKPELLHLPDEEGPIREGLRQCLEGFEVILLTGGVSMGKFDFLPGVLEALGVGKSFHKVSQRPGKPFWFGTYGPNSCVVFSLPGNPVSSFLNYMVYFRDWLLACWGIVPATLRATLGEAVSNPGPYTRFLPVRVGIQDGTLMAYPVTMNGSGDFLSLARAGGFLRLDPEATTHARGTRHPLIPFKPLWYDT